MKNMIKILSISFMVMFSFMMITDASVKEIDNYTEDTYIIGYSKFTTDLPITADLSAQAGQYFERINN